MAGPGGGYGGVWTVFSRICSRGKGGVYGGAFAGRAGTGGKGGVESRRSRRQEAHGTASTRMWVQTRESFRVGRREGLPSHLRTVADTRSTPRTPPPAHSHVSYETSVDYACLANRSSQQSNSTPPTRSLVECVLIVSLDAYSALLSSPPGTATNGSYPSCCLGNTHPPF